jgi:hypothetical protein
MAPLSVHFCPLRGLNRFGNVAKERTLDNMQGCCLRQMFASTARSPYGKGLSEASHRA